MLFSQGTAKWIPLRNQKKEGKDQELIQSSTTTGACFGLDNLNMPILSMSHDHIVLHAMLGKTVQKSFFFENNGPITLKFGLGMSH